MRSAFIMCLPGQKCEVRSRRRRTSDVRCWTRDFGAPSYRNSIGQDARIWCSIVSQFDRGVQVAKSRLSTCADSYYHPLTPSRSPPSGPPAMELQAQGFENRLTELEAQLDRLNAALQHWRDAQQDHLRPMEQRLSQLTDQCADILKQWTATGERHALAVGELEARLTGWNDVETRLQREASSRFQALERVIEQEWATLRHLHEEPARQLRSQAESLTEICVTTAGSAQTGLERAEARLATIERDLHRRMDELSRDLSAAVAELRHRNEAAGARRPASPWSLEEVTRLHHELRDVGASRSTVTDTEAELAVVDGAGTSLTPRVAPSMFGTASDSVQRDVAERIVGSEAAGLDVAPPPPTDWRWRAGVTGLASAVVVAIALAVLFYRQAGAAA